MNYNLSADELVAVCLKEEAELQFEGFTFSDIKNLGSLLVELAEAAPKPVALEIKVNGLIRFCHYPEGTSEYYRMVLEKKHNTANTFEKSSLRFFAENAARNLDPEKDMFLDGTRFQFRGGSFPIRLKDGLVIGSIAVSGMAHTEDHELIITALRKYLSK